MWHVVWHPDYTNTRQLRTSAFRGEAEGQTETGEGDYDDDVRKTRQQFLQAQTALVDPIPVTFG